MKKVVQEGAVRVDLLGGTLDIEPINLILPDVVTLNVATSLKAKVELEEISQDQVIIESKDYNETKYFECGDFTSGNIYGQGFFEHYTLVVQILDLFDIPKSLMGGLKITLQSDAPPGSGLGGSSAMAITLYKALHEFCRRPAMNQEDKLKALQIVKATEARILDSGQTGYQDYYPALFGGVLALEAKAEGVLVNQLYNLKLVKELEERLTLVYSGQSRLSGINNWEVYKKFFDKDETVRKGLEKIANLSQEAFQAFKDEEVEKLVNLVAEEGRLRKNLFSNIMTEPIENLLEKIQGKFPESGIKICGAGGGGCFLVTHKPENKHAVHAMINSMEMKILPFEIDPPLD